MSPSPCPPCPLRSALPFLCPEPLHGAGAQDGDRGDQGGWLLVTRGRGDRGTRPPISPSPTPRPHRRPTTSSSSKCPCPPPRRMGSSPSTTTCPRWSGGCPPSQNGPGTPPALSLSPHPVPPLFQPGDMDHHSQIRGLTGTGLQHPIRSQGVRYGGVGGAPDLGGPLGVPTPVPSVPRAPVDIGCPFRSAAEL